MASTISNINTALVDERVVEALRYALPMAKLVSFGVEAEEKLQNDIIRVPIATDPTVATKTAGTLLTAGGTLAGTNVTLSSFRGSAWDATEGSISAMTVEKYWADKAAGAVYVTVKDALDACLAQLTAANFPGAGLVQVTAAADFNQSAMASLWAAALKQIKRQDKTLLMNAAYAGTVFGNSNLGLQYAFAGDAFFKTGKLSDFVGMPLLVYPDLSATLTTLGAVVLGRAALLLGSARPSMLMESGEGNIVDRRVITDPDSGLSVMYTMKADAGGTITGEVCMLYGVAVGQQAAVRCVSQADSSPISQPPQPTRYARPHRASLPGAGLHIGDGHGHRSHHRADTGRQADFGRGGAHPFLASAEV